MLTVTHADMSCILKGASVKFIKYWRATAAAAQRVYIRFIQGIIFIMEKKRRKKKGK